MPIPSPTLDVKSKANVGHVFGCVAYLLGMDLEQFLANQEGMMLKVMTIKIPCRNFRTIVQIV